MNKSIFLSLLVTGGLALAETPKDLQARFPAGDADWTVTYERKRPGADRNADSEKLREERKHAIREIEVVRRGNMRRDIVHWTNGKSSEFWWPADASFVLLEAKNQAIAVVKPSILGDRRLDETIFTWINAKTFQGEKTFRGRKCLYFKSDLADGLDTDTGKKLVKSVEAWLDAETLEPLAWSNGVNLVTFQFRPPGADPLVMPSRFRKEFDKWSAYLDPKRS